MAAARESAKLSPEQLRAAIARILADAAKRKAAEEKR